ncbi:MAG TPA: hypothetical protein VFF65_11940 [Phycisphaerales bacterium]|nr:hypothetical protein [Phycisphaerales bacterium]
MKISSKPLPKKRLVKRKVAAPARGGRYDAFLRRLRAGGRSNMYGAIPYLMARFELDREAAFRVVCDWVDRQAAEAAADPGTPARVRSA